MTRSEAVELSRKYWNTPVERRMLGAVYAAMRRKHGRREALAVKREVERREALAILLGRGEA